MGKHKKQVKTKIDKFSSIEDQKYQRDMEEENHIEEVESVEEFLARGGKIKSLKKSKGKPRKVITK